MSELDKQSPIPLYYQLYTILLSDIRNGNLKPGDMILPETELMEKYGVSRATVRHALQDLAHEGYVSRAKSKGTVVQDNSVNVGYHKRVKGFSAISRENKIVKFTTRVLVSAVVDPPKAVQEALQLKDGEKAFYLKRVRSIQGRPHVFVEDWLDYKRCEGIEKIDFTESSLYDTMEEQFHVTPYRAVRTFECCYAETEEQLNELKIRKNESLLRCTSYVYDTNDRPLEFYVALVNGKYTVNE